MKRRFGKNSITNKLTVFVIAIILFQAVLFSAFLNFGGVIDKGRENAYKSFTDTVANRNSYIQSEMKNNWTNLTPYIQEFSDNISGCNENTEFYKKSVDTLIKMLRTSHASGVFIILGCEDGMSRNQLSSIYIRDYDPFLNDFTNKDLYYLYGPPEIAKELQIPLDQNWSYRIDLTDENQDFFMKPWENPSSVFDPRLTGYWSKPFKLHPDDFLITTFSMPFFDGDGKLRGVIGTEVSLNYVQQFLPASEIQNKDSLGYLIGYKSPGEDKIMPIIMTGAMQKRMIYGDRPLTLTPEDEEIGLYKVAEHQGKDEIFASIQKIGIYLNNTPFQEEEWYLIGLMGEETLLSYVNNIRTILYMSLFVSVLIGIVGSSYISYRVTRPIINLSKKVRESERKDIIIPESTGLHEVDELAEAMAAANNAFLDSSMKMNKIIELVDVSIGAFEYSKDQEDLFVTDQLKDVLNLSSEKMEQITREKQIFIDFMEDIYKNCDPEEEDIYSLGDEAERWVKIKTFETEANILGVILDVTIDIKEKKEIKSERDYDNLTRLYNRNAGNRLFSEVVNSGKELKSAAVVMFDLDALKDINDTYGHNFGDYYIRETASRLKRVIPAGKSILSRRSGDEFLLFLYKYPDKETIRKEMETFFSSLKGSPIDYPDGTKGSISISAGLAWYEDTNSSYEDMINKADQAMYRAKRTQKGTIQEWSGEET